MNGDKTRPSRRVPTAVVVCAAVALSALLLSGISALAGGSPPVANDDPKAVEIAKLLADGTLMRDNAGWAVAIDGTTAIVGSRKGDGVVLDSGVAYVFVRSGAQWSQEATLDAPGAAGGDEFGAAVAVSGETAVVGAWKAKVGGTAVGLAHAFTRSGGTWSHQATLTAPSAENGAEFGIAVAVSGDRAIIGADKGKVAGIATGRAHAFARSGSVWSHEATLAHPGGVLNDTFGAAVALEATTCVISAKKTSDGGQGHVFVHDGAWAHEATLTHSPTSTTEFGYAVALSGDTCVIGDVGHLAEVFVRDGGSWSRQATLTPIPGPAGRYGTAVAIEGDTCLVGAYEDDTAGTRAGAVFVYSRSGASWSQQEKLLASDAADNDYFGYSVGLSEDTAIVGAYGDDDLGDTAGAAYLIGGFSSLATEEDVTLSVAAPGVLINDTDAEADPLTASVATGPAHGSLTLNPDGSLDYTPNANFNGIDTFTYRAHDGASYSNAAVVTITVAPVDDVPVARDDPEAAEVAELMATDGVANDFFGYSSAVDGDTAVIGAPYEDDLGGNAGAAYVFVRSGGTWTQQAKLIATDVAAGDLFGASVAISGDTVAVGAYRDDGLGTDAGSVHVFVRSGSTWTRQAELTAADGAAGDELGGSVAVSGDSVLAGAALDDHVAADSGSAYVFTRSGTTWTEEGKLTAADAAAGDRFGCSVALSGDSAVVGAWWDDDNGGSSGSAYVFTRSGSTWTQQGKLLASDGALSDYFGGSVAIDGDTAVVGAYANDDNGASSGSGYVFTRSGGTWTEQQKLLASDGAVDDQFGKVVAVSGDTVVLSAPYDDDHGDYSGSAYVFKRAGSVWGDEDKVTASDGDGYDYFGYSVAVDGDTVLVGARAGDGGVADSGSAYVFDTEPFTIDEDASLAAPAPGVLANDTPGDGVSLSTSLTADPSHGTLALGADGSCTYTPDPDWHGTDTFKYRAFDGDDYSNEATVTITVTSVNDVPVAEDDPNIGEIGRLLASDGASEDLFGWCVAVSGDTAVVGAREDDDNGADSGSAYVFTRSGSTWTQQAKLAASDGAAEDYFGQSVAISGDTVVVGAGYDDNAGGTDAGAAYVFTRTGSTWTEQAKLTGSDSAAGDIFGWRVAIDGETCAVGAEADDNAGGTDAGAAYVFTRTGSTWTEQAKLTASDGAMGDELGFSVAVSADTVAVGARDDDDNGFRSGSAYVFTRTGSTWTEQAKLTASDGAADDYFGWSVALDGDTALIGAPWGDSNATDSGSAYVFTRTGSTWTQQAEVGASDGAAGDQFGRYVALAGRAILIGAPFDDDNGGESGSAYLFTSSGSGWIQQDKLTASDGAAYDNLGFSVALSGQTGVMGAPGDDDNGSASGSAHLFEVGSYATDEDTTLTVSAPGVLGNDTDADGESLSTSVTADPAHGSLALNGDGAFEYVPDPNWHGTDTFTYKAFDGTAYSNSAVVTITVTSVNDVPMAADDATTTPEDAAVVMDAPGVLANDTSGDGNPTASLTAYPAQGRVQLASDGSCTYTPDPDFSGTDTFRYRAFDGADYSNEATVTVVVTPAEDPPVAADDPLPRQLAALLGSDIGSNDRFGYSVAVDGDTAVVGSPQCEVNVNNGNPSGAYGSGAAHVFVLSGSSWTKQASLTAPDAVFGDGFGLSVAVSGDTVVVGAPYDDDLATDVGNAYVFRRTGGAWSPETSLAAMVGLGQLDPGGYFGFSVAVDETVCAVGAPRDFGPAAASGQVWTFQRSSDWTVLSDWSQDDGAAGDMFGCAVSLDGRTGLVGARNDSNAKGTQAGAAYLFTASGESYPDAKLLAVQGQPSDHFGSSATLDGDRALVGAPDDDEGGADSGSASVFVRSGSVWSQAATLTASDGAAGDALGTAVALSGDRALVGAPGDDAGSASFFIMRGGTWSQEATITGPYGSSPPPAQFGRSLALDGDRLVAGAPLDDTEVGPADPRSRGAYVFGGFMSATTAEDSALWVAAPGVLGNDADSDGDSLSASLTGHPAHGALVLNADGSFGYTPDADWCGTDTFTYKAFDGTSYSATATVSITVESVNDVPIAVDDATTTAEDTAVHMDAPGVLGNDTDADGDSLSTSLTVDPAHGSLTLGADGSCTYTPDPDWSGTDTFKYKAFDGDEYSNEATVAIAVTSVNDAPVATDDPAAAQIAKLLASDGAASDAFGYSVAIDGDTALVGASDDDDNGYGSGSAYIFVRSGSTWTQQAKLTASDGAANDCFGAFVAIDGDTAVVGAYMDDSSQGSAYVFTRAGSAWTQQAKLTASDGAANDYFGAFVAIEGDTVVTGAYGDDDAGDLSGSAYVFTRSGSSWTQQAKLAAADGAADDRFGSAVALAGDTAVVGAETADGSAADCGSAYVFTRAGSAWTQQAKLTAGDGAESDYFGDSAAIDGDTAIIGALRDDDLGGNSGSAYVFARSGSVWTQQQKLTASDGVLWDMFGCSVALSGDTAIIGALRDDDMGADSGSAYLFTWTGSTWTERQKLTASDGAAGDSFGSAVAICGDNVVAGVPSDDDSGSNSGSACLFDLKPYRTDEDTALSVAAPGVLGNDGDADGDSLGTSLTADPAHGVLVLNADGSFGYTPDADWHGTDTFTYKAFDGTAYSNTAVVTITVTSVNDAPVACDDATTTAEDTSVTGSAPGVLANDTDVDGDSLTASLTADPAHGELTLWAGGYYKYTPYANWHGTDTFTYQAFDGTAYSSEATVTITVTSVEDTPTAQDDSTFGEVARLLSADLAEGDSLGYSVAIDGDTAVVAARYDNDDGLKSGSAYVFTWTGSSWTEQAKLTASDAAAGDRFGTSADIHGDTVVVGADRDDAASVDDGSAYVFTRSGSTWTQQAKLTASDGADSDLFGISVAVHGDAVVVGAHRDDDAGADTGSAYVFTRSGSAWIQQQKLTAADGAAGDNFGYAVALEGDTALIGAYGDDDGFALSGSVYVFTRSGSTWSEQTKLTRSDAAGGDYFGYSVALEGGTACVGAYGDDDNGVSSGSAYVFTGSGASWTEQAKLTASDGAASERFGHAVAIDGDTVVAGAIYDADAGTASGSAYVFGRSEATWTERCKLAAFQGAAGDEFGSSVGVAADRVLVAAPKDDSWLGSNCGSARVFQPGWLTVEEDQALSVAAPGVLMNDTDGDGDSLSAFLAAGPAHATSFTLHSDGSLDYTPDADWFGQDTFEYKVFDGDDYSDTAVVTITVRNINDVPVAADDATTTPEDTPLSVAAPGVLANDTDVDGDSLATSLTAEVAHGTLTLNADGSYDYTPDLNWFGDDLFTYQAFDGTTHSANAVATITVTPVNDPPELAVSPVTLEGNTGGGYTGALPGVSATDVDDDQASLVLSNDAPAVIPLGTNPIEWTVTDPGGATDTAVQTVTIVDTTDPTDPPLTSPSHTVGEPSIDHTIEVSLSGATDTCSGVDGFSVSWSQNASEVPPATKNVEESAASTTSPFLARGTWWANVRTVDNAGNWTGTCHLGPFIITDPPVAEDDFYSVEEDEGLFVAPTLGVLVNDFDWEDDPLAAVLATGPAHGSLELDLDGAFVYIPDPDFNGEDVFTYRAFEGRFYSDPATVTITVTPDAVPVAGDDPEAREIAKLLANDGDAYDWLGGRVAVSGDTAVVGALGDDDKGSSAGAAYVFTRSGGTWTQQAKLTASDGGASDLLGGSVAISGDIIVLGAQGDDDKGSSAGAAYVFTRSAGIWTQRAKLTASDGAPNDIFGRSVAVDGDTAVVGAYYDDDKGTDSGSAYVFIRSGTLWPERAKLTDPGGAEWDYFGDSVAISGDTIVVGATGDDTKGDSSGCAVVFAGSGSLWAATDRLTASGGAAYDYFGNSVAISGDTAVVGAYRDDENGIDSGSAHVFARAGTWTQQATLTAMGDATGEQFGESVAISGGRVVVGARGDDEEGSSAGAAHVFIRSGSVWTREPKLTAPDGAGGDNFGASVSVSGDTVLVGSPGDSDGASYSGSAYAVRTRPYTIAEDTSLTIGVPGVLFNDHDPDGGALAASLTAGPVHGSLSLNADGSFDYTPDAHWYGTDTFRYRAFDGDDYSDAAAATITVTPDAVPIAGDDPSPAEVGKLLASDGAIDDCFGYAVAVDGDTAVVGAYADDDNGTNSGSAYVFVRTGGAWVQQAKLLAYDGATGDHFGISVAVSGDTVAVGASGDDSYRGSVYLFTRSGSTWTQTQKLITPTGVAGDHFGCSVALYGSRGVAGADWDDDGGYRAGSVWSFKYSGSAWSIAKLILAPDAASEDCFGSSVALYGNSAVVGAPYDNNIGPNAGSAYVITDPTEDHWAVQQKLVASDGADFDNFGSSVDVYYDTAVVGASSDDDKGERSGSAYVFTRSASTWTEQAKLTAPDGAAQDSFGVSVAVYGQTALVGAFGDDDNGYGSGSTYLSTRSGSAWSTPVRVGASDGKHVQEYGISVALHGDTGLIGARGNDQYGRPVGGSAYVIDTTPYTIAEDTSLTIAAPGVLGNDSGGDGPALAPSLSAGPAHGSVALNPDGSFVYTPELDFWGTDTFRYRAFDGDDYSNTAVATITVTPLSDVPIARPDTITATEDETRVVVAPGVLANDYHGDGLALYAQLVSGPSHGTLQLRSDGACTYTPAPDFWGTDTFRYYAAASGPNSAPTTVTVVVAPVSDYPPIARYDTADATEDTTLTVDAPGVLANDSDPETEPITAVLTVDPAHGSVVLEPDGSYEYVPDKDFFGADEFRYRATDGTFQSNTSKVTISVAGVDDPPIAVDDATSTAEDTPLSVTAPGVLGNDIEVDGDALTASLVAGTSHGALTLDADGSFDYTPALDFTGTDTFTYKAYDGTTYSDPATVTITVEDGPDSPVARPDPLPAEIAKLMASDAGQADYFGHSVDISGDTCVVGAPQLTGVFNAGSAHVFRKSGSRWVQEAKLTASDGIDGECFGKAVSLDGDTLAVSAYLDLEKGFGAGAAYIFTRSGSTWTQRAKIVAPDGAAEDRFGFSLDLDDGTLIVGSYGDDDLGTDSGSAYVFTGSGSSWTQQAKLNGSDSAAADRFGWSVAVQDDTVLVGAAYHDEKGADSGSVYVFDRTGVTWSEAQTLAASDGTASDQFGTSVALQGGTALVGAPYDEVSQAATDAGAAYVFERSGASFSQTMKLTGSGDPGIFGHSVDLAGNTALIGEPCNGSGGSNAGAAYSFVRSGTTWQKQAQLVASDPGIQDLFGYSVALADGGEAVIGSHLNDGGGSNAGAAYIFGSVFSATTDMEQTLTVAAPGVLGNDTDPDGDSLTTSLTAEPANGTLALAADGSFTYLPHTGFSGTDTFEYVAFDGTSYSGSAIVTLTVVARPGGITGTVTDGAAPLGGITVDAWRWNGSTWVWQKLAGTKADGTYSLASLPVGQYRIRFTDKANRYVTEYYDDSPAAGGATSVTVGAGATTSAIDAVMQGVGRISGVVRDQTGRTLVDMTVGVWRFSGSDWVWHTCYGTRPDGSYTIGYLPTGAYRIRFSDKLGGYITEYYDDAATLAAATDIAITPGLHATGMDATLTGVGRISGTVRNGAGAPLPNIVVDAWRYNGSTWVWERCIGTRTDGTYVLGTLPVGTYRIRFSDKTYTYKAEYYDDKTSLPTATDIVLSAGTHASGTDAVLGPGP